MNQSDLAYNSNYWFYARPDDVHTKLWPYVKYLQTNQNYMQQQNLLNMNLYGDFDAMGLSPYEYTRSNSYNMTGVPKVTYNICKSIADTAQSRLTDVDIVPQALTEEGDYSQQEKAENINRFTEGVFYETKANAIGKDVGLDCFIGGTGFFHPYRKDNNKIGLEKVFFNEIVVDDNQAMTGAPQQLFRVKYVSRDVAMAHFPKHKKLLSVTNPAKVTQSTNTMYTHDIIQLVEAWRLPTTIGGKDGVHCIIAENVTLLREGYKRSYFPVIPLRWSKQPIGYFGKGICSALKGIQIEINTILRTITRSIRLHGVPRLLMPMGSKINPSHITDEIGAMIYHAPGMEPQVWSQPIIQPEIYAHLKDLKNEAYDLVGMNQLMATGRKPEGLNSGVAINSYADINTQRFSHFEHVYQETFVELAKQMMDIAHDIYEEEGEFETTALDDNGFKKILLSDLDITNDEYVMKIWPVNFFSKSPSAKLQQVQELTQTGMLTPDQGKKLLRFPDLEEEESFNNSQEKYLEKVVEGFTQGQYSAPEPYADTQTSLDYVRKAYLYYVTNDLPEEKLQLFRDYMDSCSAILIQQQPAQAPMMAPQGPQAAAPLTAQ